MVCKKVDKLSNVFTDALTAVKLCPAVFVIYVTRLPPEFLDCRLSPTVGHHTQTHPNTTQHHPTHKPKSQWKAENIFDVLTAPISRLAWSRVFSCKSGILGSQGRACKMQLFGLSLIFARRN